MDDPQIELGRNRAKQFGEDLKKKRSPAPVQLQVTELHHKNDHVTRHIEQSLIDKKEYKVDRKANQLVHHHQFEAPRNRGIGEMKFIIEGLAEQAHETITVALDSLGDACRDTFVAVTGLFIQEYGTNDMARGFLISVDEILDACGKQRSNGSFKPEQRAEVIKHLKTLSQARIKFSMPSTKQVRRGRKWVTEDSEITVEGPILLHNGKIGEYLKITGKELWEKQFITLGPWAKFIGSSSTIKTKLLPQQVLAYNPSTEPYHKRLGHYISGLFRNNAQRTKGVMPHGITMRALFEGAFIEPSRNRGEFKDDIDKALKHLKQDEVIGSYWYMNDKILPAILEKIAARQGRWFKDYLRLYINFSPPQATLDHYKNIVKKEQIEGDENED